MTCFAVVCVSASSQTNPNHIEPTESYRYLQIVAIRNPQKRTLAPEVVSTAMHGSVPLVFETRLGVEFVFGIRLREGIRLRGRIRLRGIRLRDSSSGGNSSAGNSSSRLQVEWSSKMNSSSEFVCVSG